MTSRMSFGRFRGCLPSELPADYLWWLLDLPDLRQPLRLLFLRCCAVLDSPAIALGPMIDARETSARLSAGRCETA